jgi:alanyl aminopeptidase
MTSTCHHLLALALAVACTAAHADDASPGEVPKGPLPRTVEPSLARLELRMDPAQPRFSGRVELQVDVATPTDTIWMHGRGLTIRRAVFMPANGRNESLQAQEADVSGVLRLTAARPLAAGRAVIAIDYDAPFGELQGAYRVKPDGRDYVVTQMEPLGARTTFPGFDEPSFKHPWEITLIVPRDEVAVANSAEVKTEMLADGWKKVTFARTEALPSYLIAFAVGPWDVPEGPTIAPNGVRSVPIRLRGLAAKGQGPRMRYSLAHTPAIVAALEDYFGLPYPYDKLDNVAAPDFWAGAMENAGLIVYRESLMFPDETSAVQRRQAYWSVSAHELAHQWFGNLVTMKWWDDLWLNEGFATWMASKIHGRLQPQSNADRALLERGLTAMAADSLASTRRVREPIRDFTDIQSAFDGITYSKGGATLAMFERYIGEENFRAGIRDYLIEHSRGNATSADLFRALAKRSDDPAATARAFASFIDQPGVPFVDVALDCSGPKPALVLAQRRYLPIGSTAAATQTWGIPMSVRYDDGGTVREQKGLFADAKGRIELAAATRCPGWVMPNAYGSGYYRFALEPAMQQALASAFDRLDAREQRVLADSTLAAYGAGVTTPAGLLAALPRFAGAEMRQTVTAAIPAIEWMSEHLATDASARSAIHAEVARVFRPRLDRLGLAPRTGEAEDDALLRASLVDFFALELRDPQVRREMGRLGRAVLGLDAGGALAPDAAPRDLRDTALAVAVQDGGTAAFDAADRHLRETQDAVLRTGLLAAMGGTGDATLDARMRALVEAPGLLRRNEILTALGGQSRDARGRIALRAWLDANFESLESRLSPAGAALVGLYAEGMCSAPDARALQATFATRMAAVEGGPRDLQQAVETIGLCAAQKAARAGLPLTAKR